MEFMKKILYVTGTRADYGKMKPLMKATDAAEDFETYVYVSGMHLLSVLGDTFNEVLKDHYQNMQVAYGQANTRVMSYDLGNVICDFTGYVRKIKPDMIVVHGDRIDALAGAIVGALNNIRVAHIEGGELSGTIDESIRHAISKFAHLHLVANEPAKKRLIQLGEDVNHIFVIGSPDIDVMLSDKLPDKEKVRKRYDIDFDHYGILMYHPVTTEYPMLHQHIREVVDAVLASGQNYVVVYPNNDTGYELILNEYHRLSGTSKYRIFPSLRFEYFLSVLKNADFILGNSSAGIREAGVYGIPAIDIGNRQSGRYSVKTQPNIQHVAEDQTAIMNAIKEAPAHRFTSDQFGNGRSTENFMELLRQPETWTMELQKHFNDLSGDLYD